MYIKTERMNDPVNDVCCYDTSYIYVIILKLL